MTTTGVLLLVASSLYCGFQWTIRVLVYPQFATVPTPDFVAYERQHTNRVSIAVGPLFAFFAVAAVAALVVRPDAWSVIAAACFAGILAATGLAAVPQHRRLSTGFDTAVHRRLLAVDSLRLALSVVAVLASAAHAVRG